MRHETFTLHGGACDGQEITVPLEGGAHPYPPPTVSHRSTLYFRHAFSTRDGARYEFHATPQEA